MALLFITLLPLILPLSSAFDTSGFAQRVEVGLTKRYAYAGGGWALSAKSCPAGSTFNSCDEACCPHSLPWQGSTGCESTAGRACCPPGEECEDAITATPFCADSSWVLWNTTDGSYFCCLDGQQGTNSVACVNGKSVVASTLLAQNLGNPVPTGGASATATYSVSATGADTASSGSAAATTTSGTNTSKSTASSTTSGGGIIHSVVSSVTHSGAVPARPFEIGSATMSIAGIFVASVAAGVGIFGSL